MKSVSESNKTQCDTPKHNLTYIVDVFRNQKRHGRVRELGKNGFEVKSNGLRDKCIKTRKRSAYIAVEQFVVL